jgi:dihydroorotate dehydrogenase (NAD+) catalytic subunit
MNADSPDLSVSLGRLRLKNPVMPSSGTFGYGEEFSDFLNIQDLGAVVVKGTTLLPRLGNFEHRFTEISGGASIMTVGLQNVGVDRFIGEKLPYLLRFGTPVIVNIAGHTVDEFVRLAEILSAAQGVSALEINLTCPNVKEGGAQFSASPEMTFTVVRAVRQASPLTIIAKFSPVATDAVILARACEEAGADAVCPNHTAIGMAVDIHTRRSKLGRNLAGGVGGPWKKAVGVRLVWEVARSVRVPVVGCGGITGAEDALEYLIVGATAVQIGTYGLINPRATVETIHGLSGHLVEKGMKSIRELIGTFEVS